MGDMEKEEDATFISAQSGGDTSGVKPRGWRPFWVRCGSEPEYKQQFLDTLCVWASFFVFVSIITSVFGRNFFISEVTIAMNRFV